MYRDFGETYRQAPIIEELKECGQIGTQRFLEHEMAEMSPVEKMSYLQSRTHFDESMEISGDSDLEDGEIGKLLTSSLYAQRASSEDQTASGKPAALFFNKT